MGQYLINFISIAGSQYSNSNDEEARGKKQLLAGNAAFKSRQ
jgi:hypothetical protein